MLTWIPALVADDGATIDIGASAPMRVAMNPKPHRIPKKFWMVVVKGRNQQIGLMPWVECMHRRRMVRDNDDGERAIRDHVIQPSLTVA
jgi:hypothetical protein